MLMLYNDENWFLVTGTGYRMIDVGLISLRVMSAAGFSSLVGRCDALPHKQKNHLNSPKFRIIPI